MKDGFSDSVEDEVSTSVSAREFFNHVCPKVLSARESTVKQVGGRYGFRVTGQTGGEWIIDFGSAQVLANMSKNVDVNVEMAEADFSSLLQGRLDIEAALENGRIMLKGETQKLAALGLAFQPVD